MLFMWLKYISSDRLVIRLINRSEDITCSAFKSFLSLSLISFPPRRNPNPYPPAFPYFLSSHFPPSFSFPYFTLSVPTRSQPSPICPNSPGRTPLFTMKCSQRNVCHSRTHQPRARISNLYKSWTCGSSI